MPTSTSQTESIFREGNILAEYPKICQYDKLLETKTYSNNFLWLLDFSVLDYGSNDKEAGNTVSYRLTPVADLMGQTVIESGSPV